MQSRRYTLLYIDDEKNNLTIFKSAFYKEYQVLTAISAEEGLKLISENDVDLIISDHRMPEMSGIEFLEIAYQRFPEVPRLVITAYADVDLVIDAINRCGIYQYILKPWDPRELKLIIENALQKYELQQRNNQLIYELKQSNEQLEQKIEKRTLDLEKTNQELHNAIDSKNKLFSIISHDLMTPMLSLGILLDVILKMEDNVTQEKLHQYSSKIKSYLQNVTEMLENLLNWSISQMENEKPMNKKLAANEILKKNYELYKIAADKKNIKFEIDQAKEEFTARGDVNMVNIILRNLISNAIKFTHSNGNIKLTTSTADNQVIFSVHDNGIGIDSEMLPQVFNKNYHKSTVGTQKEKGTGIGLKLCKEFVDKLGGNIWVHSKPKEGSVFSFSLPLAKSQVTL